MNPDTKNIIAWVLTILLAMGFLGVGMLKIFGGDQMVQQFEEWHFPMWSMYAVGVAEVILGIGLFIPGLARFTCSIIYIWAGAAIATHILSGQFSQIPYPAIFGLIAFIISWLRKED